MIGDISDLANATSENEPPNKVHRLQDHNYCIAEEQGHASDPIGKLTMNWDLLRKQMIGLANKDGTTCYINSLIQCLANTPPLVDWLFAQLNKLNTCK